MTDRAPRPEGMSDRRLAELKLAVAPGATTYDGIDPNGRCLTCGQQPCECEIGMLREACREIDRLRADGATLRERVTQLEATIDLLSSDDEVKALVAGLEEVKAGRITPFAGLPADRHGFAGLPEKDQPK